MKLGDLFIKLGLKSQEFEQGISKAKKSTNDFGSIVKKVGVLLGVAFGIDQVITFGKEIFKLSGELKGIEDAFKRIGTSKDLENLRKSTNRTVSDLELMRQAVMAENFGIPVKELGNLLEFASKRAQDTGQSIDYLVNSIVVGIGRKSPLILDNLGISMVQLNSKLGDLSMEAATVGDVAKAVGEIASEAMEKSGKLIESNTVKAAQAKTAWDNFKLSLAAVLNESEAIETFFNGLTKQLQMLPENLKISGRALTFVFGSLWGADSKKRMDDFWKELDSDIEQFNKKLKESQTTEEDKTEATKNYGRTINELKKEIEDLLIVQGNLGEFQKAESLAISARIKKIQELINSLTVLQEVQKRAENRQVGAIAPGQQFSGTLTARKGQYGRSENVWMQDLAPLQTGDLEFEKLAQSIEDNEIRASQMLAEIPEDWQRFNQQLGSLIQDFGTDVVAQFGEAMGTLLATGEFDGDFGLKLLESIGRFVSTLGSMLIALGLGSESFKQLLGSGFLSGGVGAIAAGALLVAAGGAISGYARSRARGGSGSAGGGSGMFNQNYNIQQASASGSQATLFLKGDNIYMSQQRNAFKRGVIG